MGCESVKGLIGSLLTGEKLEITKVAEIAIHLGICESCLDYFNDLCRKTRIEAFQENMRLLLEMPGINIYKN